MFAQIEYYSIVKINEIMKFTGQQIKLGNIVLSAVTKAQKDKFQGLFHMWVLDLNL